MKKRLISIALVLVLLVGTFVGLTLPNAAADGSNPSVNIYVNGQWCSAKQLTGLSGSTWLTFPIPNGKLKNGVENYVRIASNVANGTTDDTQVKIYMTNAGWSNTYLSTQAWVDDWWSTDGVNNANIYIEGFDGEKWVRIHDDNSYAQSSASVLGRLSDGGYQGYARNIVLAEGTVGKYVNFRVKAQLQIGTNLTVNPEVAPLFPSEHYVCCTFCDVCGGCLDPNCTMSHFMCNADANGHHCPTCPACGKCTCTEDCGCTHVKCTCGGQGEPQIGNDPNASIRVRVNSQWYGLNVSDKAAEGLQWVYVPVELSKLRGGDINYLQLSANAENIDNYSDNSIDVCFTTGVSGTSFITNDRYCDNGYTAYPDRELNLMLELYDGEQWVPAITEEYRCDEHSVIGYFKGDGQWYGYARNLEIGALDGYELARVAVQIHVGSNIKVVSDYAEENFAVFLDPQLAADDPANADDGHKTSPDAPASGTSGGSTEGAMLQIRLNGTSWYETSLDGISTDENGCAWVPVEFPVAKLRADGENQLLVTSNVKNGAEYSINSVDLFASAVAAGDSFNNLNDYYDDWERFTGYEFDIALQATKDGTSWVNLGGEAPAYYDAHRLLGKRADDSGSYAARNFVIGSLEGYTAARVIMLVHIGTSLNADASENVTVDHRETPPEIAPAKKAGTQGSSALLYVRTNGKWHTVKLADHLGKTDWVYCDVGVNELNGNAENYFNFATNVVCYGKDSDSSVEFYATKGRDQLLFLTNDPYCDNDWQITNGLYADVKVEFYDGANWVTVPAAEDYFYDNSYLLGKDGGSGKTQSGARNIVLPDLSGYTKARVGILLHVGSKLTTFDAVPDGVYLSHSSKVPEEAEGAEGITDSKDAMLRVRANGVWYETPLEEYKNSGAVWVPVPVDINVLRSGEENYFSVSTNVASHGRHSATSVDIYYTNASQANGDVNSFICDDEFADLGYRHYEDRNINLRVEVFDGTEWKIMVPHENTYYDGSIPLGFDCEQMAWSVPARNLILGNLANYSEARVCVQLHVGGTLEQMSDDYGADTDAIDIDRTQDVGRPGHDPNEVIEEPAEPTEPSQPEEKNTVSPVLKGVVIAAASAVGAAGILWLIVALARKKKKEKQTE